MMTYTLQTCHQVYTYMDIYTCYSSLVIKSLPLCLHISIISLACESDKSTCMNKIINKIYTYITCITGLHLMHQYYLAHN